MSDPIVFSTPLDNSYPCCGLPFCAQGSQPSFQMPVFFPDNLRPFISEQDLKELLDKLNKIFLVRTNLDFLARSSFIAKFERKAFPYFSFLFQSTGFPLCPSVIFLFVLCNICWFAAAFWTFDPFDMNPGLPGPDIYTLILIITPIILVVLWLVVFLAVTFARKGKITRAVEDWNRCRLY